jgi:site-specific DNA-cytosine methylase
MNVLSLFDGISVARQALSNCNIPINKYYCCEIDKFAIKVSKKNWPDNIHMGNVKDFSNNDLNIDLLIGGSPCQDLSIAKRGRKGLEGDRSSLFWEYIRIRDLVKPKLFILENVASMKKEDRDIITKAMGVEPVMFNASLVSAQCRKRLFWTNINFELPTNKQIYMKDILDENAEPSKDVIVFEKTEHRGTNEIKKLGYINGVDHQAYRIYDVSGKMATLTTSCNSRVSVDGYRKLTPIECERLQSLPDNYTDCVSKSQRYKCIGNAFNCNVISHIINSSTLLISTQ